LTRADYFNEATVPNICAYFDKCSSSVDCQVAWVIEKICHLCESNAMPQICGFVITLHP